MPVEPAKDSVNSHPSEWTLQVQYIQNESQDGLDRLATKLPSWTGCQWRMPAALQPACAASGGRDHLQPVQLGKRQTPSHQGHFLNPFTCIPAHASILTNGSVSAVLYSRGEVSP